MKPSKKKRHILFTAEELSLAVDAVSNAEIFCGELFEGQIESLRKLYQRLVKLKRRPL